MHTDPDRRRAQRQLAVLAAAVVLLVAAVGLVAVRVLGHARPEARHPTPAPRPVAAAPGRPAVIWREVAGVRLPFSAAHGPRVTDHGRAAGYSRTRQGAALAAVQVLARTSATAGPEVYRPVLAGQVVGARTPRCCRSTWTSGTSSCGTSRD